MKICVVGWYFLPEFYLQLVEVNKTYPVFIVAHKPGNCMGLDYEVIPNIGLEFGCYDHYLKNIWDGKSNVFFAHDDTHLSDINVFNKIAAITYDCAYVFRDKAEEAANGGKHGRAIYTSAKFLELIKNYKCDCPQSVDQKDMHHNKDAILPGTGTHTGFWHDPYNTGHVAGKPPVGIRHYNDAIYHFHWTLGRIRDGKCGNKKGELNVVNRILLPEYESGRRAMWRHKDREQKRYGI